MSNKKTKSSSTGASKQRGGISSQTLNLLASAKGGNQNASKLSPLHDLKTLSVSSRQSVAAISFGKPSKSGSTSSASSSSSIASLLSSSNSVSKLLGGGLLSFGASSLFSSIADLFGGSKIAPPPLERFALPNSQQQTLYASSSGLATTNGQIVPTGSPNGTYTAYNSSAHQAAIVSAVKNALLTSSSLNDIIGEL